MIKIVFFFLFLISSLDIAFATRISDIEALKTKEPSLLNSYLDLMVQKKLLHQSSAKLKHRQLLKKNGGLCAFTANTDAIQAVSQYFRLYTGKFLKRPDYFLYQVIDEARSFMEDDPTYNGIDFPELVHYTKEVLEQYGLNDFIRYKLVSDFKQLNPDLMNQQYWKLRLIGMISQNKEEGHTVVLLRADKAQKILYISDPNFPNQVVPVPYKTDHQKVRLFLNSSWFPGFQPATVDQIIEISIPRD